MEKIIARGAALTLRRNAEFSCQTARRGAPTTVRGRVRYAVAISTANATTLKFLRPKRFCNPQKNNCATRQAHVAVPAPAIDVVEASLWWKLAAKYPEARNNWLFNRAS